MRAQVVILRDQEVLMARHECEDRQYWVLPGGSIEAGEEPEEAAVREAREESGLDVRLRRLLFIDHPREGEGVEIKSPRYTYLGEIVGGALKSGGDQGSGDPQKGRLAAVEWLPLNYHEFDSATRDTLQRVAGCLESNSPSEQTSRE